MSDSPVSRRMKRIMSAFEGAPSQHGRPRISQGDLEFLRLQKTELAFRARHLQRESRRAHQAQQVKAAMELMAKAHLLSEGSRDVAVLVRQAENDLSQQLELFDTQEAARDASALENMRKDKTKVAHKEPDRPTMVRRMEPRTIARATYFLDLLSALVPRRIANEEIGDALEVIKGMSKARRPKGFIYLKVATTFFWVSVHTLLHCAERVAGIVSLARGKSDKD